MIERQFALEPAEMYLAEAAQLLANQNSGADGPLNPYPRVTAYAAVAGGYASLAQALQK